MRLVISKLLLLLLFVTIPSVVQAALITATPNPATVNAPVQIRIISAVNGTGCPPMVVNFGDNQPSVSITGTGTTYDTTHTYSAPSANYIISATRATGSTCNITDSGILNVNISNFDIKRLELTFPENNRSEITVKRNQPRLIARADLLYEGSGTLIGYWEVDGNLLSRVNQHVLPGGRIALETPAIPPLPTFSEGSHVVRFIVESANNLQTIPALVYYVTTEESEEQLKAFKLTSPLDNSVAGSGQLAFTWESAPDAAVYEVLFFSDSDNRQVFSALTKVPKYTVSNSVLGNFSGGYSYRWQVRAMDKESKLLAKSSEWRFTLGRKAN